MVKLTSTKAYKVVKYLLENSQTSQLQISRETGVAYGWTNTVINFLHDLGIVSKSWRQCKLEDPVRLLEVIALERPLSRLASCFFRLEATSVSEGEEQLRKACEDKNVKYGLTVFSGLKRFYEYYIAFPQIHAYVSNEEVKEYVPQGEGPITLYLLSPDHPDILNETRMVNDFFVCGPAQIAIDLFCSGVGRDAAIKLAELMKNGRIRSSG